MYFFQKGDRVNLPKESTTSPHLKITLPDGSELAIPVKAREFVTIISDGYEFKIPTKDLRVTDDGKAFFLISRDHPAFNKLEGSITPDGRKQIFCQMDVEIIWPNNMEIILEEEE